MKAFIFAFALTVCSGAQAFDYNNTQPTDWQQRAEQQQTQPSPYQTMSNEAQANQQMYQPAPMYRQDLPMYGNQQEWGQ